MKSAMCRGFASLAVVGLLTAGTITGAATASAHAYNHHPLYSNACRDGAHYFHVGAWYWLPGHWEDGRWHEAHWIWCVPDP